MLEMLKKFKSDPITSVFMVLVLLALAIFGYFSFFKKESKVSKSENYRNRISSKTVKNFENMLPQETSSEDILSEGSEKNELIDDQKTSDEDDSEVAKSKVAKQKSTEEPRKEDSFDDTNSSRNLGDSAKSKNISKEKSKVGRDIININTATASEIADSLSGIGPVKSKAIVSYREKMGKFSTIDEIKNVKGIGDKTFEKIREKITV